MRSVSLYVCAFAFLFGVAYASLFEFNIPAIILEVLAVVGSVTSYCLTRKPIALLIVLAVLACTVGGVRTMLAPRELPPQFAPYVGKKIAMEGTVTNMPDERESNQRVTVELRAERATTKVIAVASRRIEYHPGDRVRVSGELTVPEPFESDGNRVFAYDRFLAKDAVFGIAQPAQVEVVGREPDVRMTVLRSLQFVHGAFSAAH